MDAERILKYLQTLAANNNREWYQEHKAEYQTIRSDFEEGVAKAIAQFSRFDHEIAHLKVKDCTYRFNRDTRFSPDKSPYKNHLGAYICAKGRKALRGGYYLHLEPGHCLIAVGSYWLPTNILTSCRNEIMGNIDEWRRSVETGQFVKMFGYPNQGDWETSDKGFGLAALKTCPAGFPKDYKHIEYLRMKDYCCWHRVDDDFFKGDGWLAEAAKIFQIAKPMVDFINSVIDDYE